MTAPMLVRGWRCAVDGATRAIDDPAPWRCPRSTSIDRRHVLRIVTEDVPIGASATRHPNPFREFDQRMAWAAFAESHGMGADRRAELVDELDAALAGGLRTTPCARSDALSEHLGFVESGGVWVKDETGAVAGSQKVRHLTSILLHLRAAEVLGLRTERPPLAIASCGNAALAAATLAAAAEWPIDVYVPTWMGDGVGQSLDELGARVHRSPRRDDDPPGDPALHRFREAVERGAVPFTVQGPENAVCLDGGRTIGWEVAAAIADGVLPRFDRVFVQVGGGAFAASLGAVLSDGLGVRLHAVQTAGCAPLMAAWTAESKAAGPPTSVPTDRWGELMRPWSHPHSAADGLLDDETYDWIGVFDAMLSTDPAGAPTVAAESTVLEAHRLATEVGGYRVSATGSAGLAGLLTMLREPSEQGERIEPTSRVLIVMSGVAR